MKFYLPLFNPLGSVLLDLWSSLGSTLSQMSIHVLITSHLHKCVACRCQECGKWVLQLAVSPLQHVWVNFDLILALILSICRLEFHSFISLTSITISQSFVSSLTWRLAFMVLQLFLFSAFLLSCSYRLIFFYIIKPTCVHSSVPVNHPSSLAFHWTLWKLQLCLCNLLHKLPVLSYQIQNLIIWHKSSPADLEQCSVSAHVSELYVRTEKV